jgi:hypothetical protein
MSNFDFSLSQGTRERVARFHATGSPHPERRDNRRPTFMKMARGEFATDAEIRAETVERVNRRVSEFGESEVASVISEGVAESVVFAVRKRFFGR